MRILVLFALLGVGHAAFSEMKIPKVQLASHTRQLMPQLKMAAMQGLQGQRPLREVLGINLPMIDKFERDIVEDIIQAVENQINDMITQAEGNIDAAFKEEFQWYVQVVEENLQMIQEISAIDVNSEMVQQIMSYLNTLSNDIHDFSVIMGLAPKLDTDSMKTAMQVVLDKGISDWWDNILDWISDAWQDIQDTLGNTWQQIQDIAEEGWNTVSVGATNVLEWISSKWPEFQNWAQTVFGSMVDATKPIVEQVEQMAIVFLEQHASEISEKLMAQALAFFQAFADQLPESLWKRLLQLALEILNKDKKVE